MVRSPQWRTTSASGRGERKATSLDAEVEGRALCVSESMRKRDLMCEDCAVEVEDVMAGAGVEV